MARETKLIINKDDFIELEVWRNGLGEVGISTGIHDLQANEAKRNEQVISLNNKDLDTLIDVLINLRYE